MFLEHELGVPIYATSASSSARSASQSNAASAAEELAVPTCAQAPALKPGSSESVVGAANHSKERIEPADCLRAIHRYIATYVSCAVCG
eukprot:755327-Pyramimonas_sp.AAC.1